MLTLSQFEWESAVFEVKYPFAFLHWDRSGTVWSALSAKWPKLQGTSAKPDKTQFRLEDRYQFTISMESAVVQGNQPKDIDEFAHFADDFVGVVSKELQIAEWRRLGFRLNLFHSTSDIPTASKAMLDLNLVRIPSGKRFGLDANPSLPKYGVRWEGKAIGATVNIEAQGRELKFEPPFGYKGLSPVSKQESGVLIDVDYFTTAPTAVGTLNPLEWIPQVFRVIQRDLQDFWS